MAHDSKPRQWWQTEKKYGRTEARICLYFYYHRSIESELLNFLRFDSILGSETSLMNPHVRLSVVWLVDWSVGRSAGWSLGLSVLTFEKAYNFIISWVRPFMFCIQLSYDPKNHVCRSVCWAFYTFISHICPSGKEYETVFFFCF